MDLFSSLLQLKAEGRDHSEASLTTLWWVTVSRSIRVIQHVRYKMVCDAGGRWRVSVHCNVFINMLMSDYPERRSEAELRPAAQSPTFQSWNWWCADLNSLSGENLHSSEQSLTVSLPTFQTSSDNQNMSDCLFEASSRVGVFAAAELLSRRLSVSVSSDRTQVSSSAQLRLLFFLFWGRRSETNRFHSRGQTVTGPSQQELTAERRRRSNSVETVKGSETKTPAGQTHGH